MDKNPTQCLDKKPTQMPLKVRRAEAVVTSYLCYNSLDLDPASLRCFWYGRSENKLCCSGSNLDLASLRFEIYKVFECVPWIMSLRSAKQFWIYFSLVLVCGKNAPSRTLVSATDEHYRFPFDFHRLDFSPLFTRCRLEMEAVSRNFVSRQVSLDHYIKIIICIKLFLYLYFVVFLFK